MKPVRSALGTILCVILLAGCAEKVEPSQTMVPAETVTVSVETTLASETVPVEIPLLDYTNLPQGYELQEAESGSLLILENGKTIGAIDIYQIPEGTPLIPFFVGWKT